jgi:transposase InsO family protein
MDITYIPMARGFVYLAAVVDWFSRRVLAWRLSITMEAAFCVEALEEALSRYGTPEIFNTAQGSQFTSAESTGALLAKGIVISMDGKGAWRDNVFVERCPGEQARRWHRLELSGRLAGRQHQQVDRRQHGLQAVRQLGKPAMPQAAAGPRIEPPDRCPASPGRSLRRRRRPSPRTSRPGNRCGPTGCEPAGTARPTTDRRGRTPMSRSCPGARRLLQRASPDSGHRAPGHCPPAASTLPSCGCPRCRRCPSGSRGCHAGD